MSSERDHEALFGYAGAYQARRKLRCKETGGVVLPLELLRSGRTGSLHLAVSFSGTGFGAVYVTQRADFYRPTKIGVKYLILPYTWSCLLDRDTFFDKFGDLFEEVEVDGEKFWKIGEEHNRELKSRIRSFDLDNQFLAEFDHSYLPDSEKELADLQP